MIDRINGYMARRFGVGTTAASFVRMHVWAVVFLIVLAQALPSHDAKIVVSRFRKNIAVQNVALGPNDARGFAKSPFGKDRFRIAWITGSEGHLIDKSYSEFVPNLVARNLPRIGGRRIGVDVYLINAMRVGDIYFSLLDAIESKPDMIVVSLNPAWALNPIATHQWTQLDSRAAVQLLSEPPSWPLAAKLLSPSDLAFGIGDKAFRPLRERSYYSRRIHNVVDDFGPLDRKGAAQAALAEKPTESQRILGMLTVDFWFTHRFHEPRAVGPVRWSQWIEKSNQGNSVLNRSILRAIAKELRDSGIPSYVYDAPVNSQWLATSKPLGAAVRGVEQQLERLRGNFTAPNILYQPITATRSLPPLVFRDVVHLKRAGPMGPYLARELCRLVAQVGDGTQCAPVRRGQFGG
jgi:hypothetical protein